MTKILRFVFLFLGVLIPSIISAQTIMTNPKAELYPIESRTYDITRTIEDYHQHKRNTLVVGDKPKRVRKPTEMKVLALINTEKTFHYQAYLVDYDNTYMAVFPSDVQDNIILNTANEALDNLLSQLEDAVEQEQTRIQDEKALYEKAKDSLTLVIRDSLSFYTKLANTFQAIVNEIEQPINEKYDAKVKELEDSVRDSLKRKHTTWFNSLPASSKKAINSLYLYSVKLSQANSAGGQDAIVEYYNRSEKTIKYFDWTGKAKNAVDDYVACEVRGRYSFSGRDTGPYAHFEKGGGVWENVIYNWSARTLVLTGITITYMDGTKFVMSEKDVYATVHNAEWQQEDISPLISSIVSNRESIINEQRDAEIAKATERYSPELKQYLNARAKWLGRDVNMKLKNFGVDNEFFAPMNNHDIVSDFSTKFEALRLFKKDNYFK